MHLLKPSRAWRPVIVAAWTMILIAVTAIGFAPTATAALPADGRAISRELAAPTPPVEALPDSSAAVSSPPADTPTPSLASTTPAPAASPGTASTASPDTSGAPGTGPTSPVAPDGGSGCGMLDLGCRAITGFFRAVVSAAVNPVFRFLAGSVLAAPRVDQISRVHSMWTTSVWVANSCFVLLVVIGGMLVMGHQSLQTSYTAKDIAPRLIVAAVAANANLLVIGPAIEMANAVSAALMGKGVDPAQAAKALQGLVVAAATGPNDVFLMLLALVAVIAAQVVVFTFALRLMALVLLTVAAPLALACHALPQTEGVARLWWRAIGGVLAIQVAQSLVLTAGLRVFFASDQKAVFGFRTPHSMLDLVLVICLLYILARIPSWVIRMISRGGVSGSPLVRIVRTLAAVLIFRRVSALAGTRTTGKGGGPRRPPPASSQPPPSLPAPPSGGPVRGEQLELPLETPRHPPRGEQLPLPLERPGRPAPQPAAPAARWTQLRLPGAPARPPRWTQTSLPIRPRYIQTRLPAPPPRAGRQAELPLAFPAPGTAAAGRSPRRLADAAALGDSEARARRHAARPRPGSTARSDRRNR
ncbi:hypothetical protein [Actinoallomurus iriomotensis]|uniref:Uncharacterized protein n=1 Tax=Actinoallomurus iriomotensis TaxID=478107 RepID=A0A9W6S2P3_9ACTN|nr:hypothetical protein [Actinoallomurus iriomotensis]GLY86068.1 hypothetical protein Airi02_039970 [Actinoallomurus iriomotensis]